MQKTTLLWVLIVLVVLCACDDYELVNSQSDESKVVNLKTCNCEIISKDALKQLREQAEVGKSIGRYQMRTEGYRTWRFDTATGRTCILLTQDWDWKKPDTLNQSCGINGN